MSSPESSLIGQERMKTMRTLGAFLILIGIIGFVYCSTQLSKTSPVPPGRTIMETLDYPAGRLELGQYAAVVVGAVGALITILPRER
jgi:drug/metabolite transporter (DMT)-like permease